MNTDRLFKMATLVAEYPNTNYCFPLYLTTHQGMTYIVEGRQDKELSEVSELADNLDNKARITRGWQM